MPARNPDWTEEELILALAVYRRIGRESVSKEHREVIALSELLNRLPIHPRAHRIEPFRDPDGVRRRLGYFAQIEAGQLLDGRDNYKLVWSRFSDNQAALEAAESQIIAK